MSQLGDSPMSAATMVAAEGARVAFVTCADCGAAILLDPREDEFDPVERHRAWHRLIEPPSRGQSES